MVLLSLSTFDCGPKNCCRDNCPDDCRRAGRGILPRADADKNGKVTKDEWQAAYDAIDQEKKGSFDHSQFQAWMIANRPGVGTPRPGKAGNGYFWTKLDADKNGQVTKAEWEALYKTFLKDGETEAVVPPRPRRGPGGGKFGGGPGLKPGPGPGPR